MLCKDDARPSQAPSPTQWGGERLRSLSLPAPIRLYGAALDGGPYGSPRISRI